MQKAVMAKSIIEYDTPYSLNDAQWVEWLAKPQWTAAEAAALSLNILPDFTRAYESTRPEGDVIRITNDGAVSNNASYSMKLIDLAKVAGHTVEHKLHRRAQTLAAGSLVAANSEFTKFSPFNMYKLIDRTETIAQMRYWDWSLPTALSSQAKPQSEAKVAEIIKAEPSKVDEDEWEVRVEKLHKLNDWPNEMPIRKLMDYLRVKEEKTIRNKRDRGEIPPANTGGENTTSQLWLKSQVDEYLEAIRQKVKAKQQAKQAIIDAKKASKKAAKASSIDQSSA